MPDATRNFAAALTAGLLFGGFADATAATTEQTSNTFTPATIQADMFGTAPPDSTAPIVGLSQFNSALGTLTAVDLTVIEYAATGNANVLNTGSEGANLTLTVTFSVSGTTASTSANGSALVPFTFSPTSAPLTLAPGAFPAVSLTTASDLLPFIGAGSVALTAAIKNFSLAGQCFGTESSCSGSGTAAFSGKVHLVYTYTPADTALPEPATIAVLGAGLAGISAFRRRRRAA